MRNELVAALPDLMQQIIDGKVIPEVSECPHPGLRVKRVAVHQGPIDITENCLQHWGLSHVGLTMAQVVTPRQLPARHS